MTSIQKNKLPVLPCWYLLPQRQNSKAQPCWLSAPFNWAGLASLLCSAGFPGCWNLLPSLLPGWAGSLVCGNKLDSYLSTCSCQRSVLHPGNLEMAFCPLPMCRDLLTPAQPQRTRQIKTLLTLHRKEIWQSLGCCGGAESGRGGTDLLRPGCTSTAQVSLHQFSLKYPCWTAQAVNENLQIIKHHLL